MPHRVDPDQVERAVDLRSYRDVAEPTARIDRGPPRAEGGVARPIPRPEAVVGLARQPTSLGTRDRPSEVVTVQVVRPVSPRIDEYGKLPSLACARRCNWFRHRKQASSPSAWRARR